MAPATLQRLRRTMVIAVPDRANSASVTLQYLSSDEPRLDPTFGAFEAPLGFWINLAFDGSEGDHQCMQGAWR